MAKVQMWITYRDLSAAGLDEQTFRGGSKYRITDFPWEVAHAHKEKLRALLEPNFDVMQPILAQETVDSDRILLTQERADR
jgi:hypothetical protein